MAKDTFQSQLGSLGQKLKAKEDTTPLQEVSPVNNKGRKANTEEQTLFTVHIPTLLLDEIKLLGLKQKKKIKTIIVESLYEYAKKHKD